MYVCVCALVYGRNVCGICTVWDMHCVVYSGLW